MRVLLLTIIALTSVLAFNEHCKPRFHFWRPYYGEIPTDAFVAGVEKDGTKVYIVKVTAQDKNFWTVQAKLTTCQKAVPMKWSNTDVSMVTEHMEIMCTDNANELVWIRATDTTKATIPKDCCIVVGGLVNPEPEKVTRLSFIGKAEEDGEVVIGRIYSHNWDFGVHGMHGNISTKWVTDYDVLTYDCHNVCKP